MKQIEINNISTSYYITKDGKCYNNKTGKYLKGQKGKNGYFSYNLTLPDGSKKRAYAHRLVAEAFLPKIEGKTYINHIDGDKLNNRLNNLEWVTAEENQQYAIHLGLRKFNPVYCFNQDKVVVAEYESAAVAARATGLATSIIYQELNKEVKTLSGNFYWSYEPLLGEVRNYRNTGRAKEVYQYDLKGKFINSYSSTGQAARSLGLSTGSHIGECCRGKIKSYKGFIWRYAEDIVSTSDESQRDTGKVS